MAYNSMYQGYQPLAYQQLQIPQPQPQPMQNTNIVWVQGEAGAKSYLVAPNTTVQLWDSEAKKIYLKSADASGMPSMKVLNYTIEGEVNEKNIPQRVDEYATKKDVADEIARLEQKIDKLSGEPARKKSGQRSNQALSDD